MKAVLGEPELEWPLLLPIKDLSSSTTTNSLSSLPPQHSPPLPLPRRRAAALCTALTNTFQSSQLALPRGRAQHHFLPQHAIHQPHTMARFSRNKSAPARTWVSPWMTAFYICAVLFMPMLFMGMLPSANAQDADTKADTGIQGPGESRHVIIHHLARAVV